MRCRRETRWGRCAQRAHKGTLCAFHTLWRWKNPPDDYYHRKVVLGVIEPTGSYLSEAEANAVLDGRKRHDGRRLDLWCPPVLERVSLLYGPPVECEDSHAEGSQS